VRQRIKAADQLSAPPKLAVMLKMLAEPSAFERCVIVGGMEDMHMQDPAVPIDAEQPILNHPRLLIRRLPRPVK
jgi:hypothetical protein